MAKIESYKAKPTPLIFEDEESTKQVSALLEFGGWNPAKKAMTPIRVGALAAKPGAPMISWVFDSLAAAAEAGVLEGEEWLKQVFASDDDLQVLVELLQESGDVWWLNDRHFWALQHLGLNEDDAATYTGVANALAQIAEDA
ncbi:hypothetical protein [Paraburkholderia sp. RL17-337-BIB-A]|uniref:hypothetical protein n=1 Tax=Paraburkholderia sp. RL17-337-BIB-A TaxID=3031636 RepID=UPI0038B722BC